MKTTFKTPAKINIFLKIGDIDPDTKLHFIYSVMVPISLYDIVTVKESDVFEVEALGINEIIPTEKNIVYKIWKETEAYINKSLPKFSVTIEKQIPNGAGLGGGSSNAAGFLLFLNRQLELGLKSDEMVDIASKVGSDVPFFILESPAIVGGTGDKIQKIRVASQGMRLLLVCPEITVNSGHAYGLFDKKKLTKTRAVTINTVRNFDGCSLKDWTTVIYNDFEEVVFSEWPEIGHLKKELEKGAQKAFMSGSGSTVIGVYSNSKDRDEAFCRFNSGEYRSVKKIELLT
jgi:4-diphosphocytidyl-2-C-methyl-D-erythritol kinase